MGLDNRVAEYGAAACMVLVILLFGLLTDVVARRLILSAAQSAILKSKTKWDDILLKQKVFHRLAHLAPALVVYVLGPFVFPEIEAIGSFIRTAAFIYMTIVFLGAAVSFLDASRVIIDSTETGKTLPLTGLIQATKLVLVFVGGLVVISMVTNKTPLYFLSGLGALTAVLMLIFKDPILGLVAGIQLSSNKMVKRGDWISMPQYGADGDVLDVTLTTVKVQNWDKTITTIPTYALISSSFKNWHGMQASGGRRIKRALYIDMTSVRFCDEEMFEKFKKVQRLKDYIERKQEEVARWNEEQHVDGISLLNGRRLTNLGTFRAYIEQYLKNNPHINQNMTMLVRHLEPGEHGIPVEVYAFSADTAWKEYETVQADIFDHLIASVPEFGLRLYQAPSGSDFASFIQTTKR